MSRIQIVFEFEGNKPNLVVLDVQAKRADIPQVIIVNCRSIFDFGDAADSLSVSSGVARLKHNDIVAHHTANGGVVNHFFDMDGMFEYIAHQDERFCKMTDLWEYSLLWATASAS